MAGGAYNGNGGHETAKHETQHILQKGQGELNAVDIVRVYRYAGHSLRHGGCQQPGAEREGKGMMTITFAAVGTALAQFAEGAVLAASVYLVSRGVKNPLKTVKPKR